MKEPSALRKPLALPCLYHTENSMKLKELDVEIDEHEVDEILFYNIDAIGPWKADDHSQTIIYTNGTDFTCVLDVETVRFMIQNWI